MTATARRHVGTSRAGHGDACYCGRRARWHVKYGSGCGHVCGIHRRTIERRKPGTVALPLEPPCASCGGRCDWADTAWACVRCGNEWDRDHGPEYEAPGG